jgi:PAS domain S-box-containing protein
MAPMRRPRDRYRLNGSANMLLKARNKVRTRIECLLGALPLADLESFSEQQRFQLLVNAITDYAVYMLDRHGRIATWNPGAERLKGYDADEVLGRHFSIFFTPEDRDGDLPGRALRIALGEGRFEAEGWRVRKDGTQFWANAVLDAVYDPDGNHVGFAKITRDLTEKKRAQEELEEARAALFQAQKLQALGELTGGIAHDFNNLMTVIAGSADFLLRKPHLPDEKRRQYLEAIADTADRATTLTNHLLAFGRRQAIKPEVLDLNVRLEAVAGILSRTLGSNVDVHLELAPRDARVEVDSTQLENAILNAAVNARDAMPDGGTLTLSTRRLRKGDGEFIALAISDTGAGMPPEVVERAFEPFFTTKEIGKGTGLGLSQIHGFAAQAGGRAEIRSQEGEGTTVTMLLPATDKEVAAATAGTAISALPKGLCVLLVEDNPHVREFAEGLLVDLGCRVVSAETADEALAWLESDGIDLVLSDVVMPGMSGVELARQIRKSARSVPVLLATGYSDEILKNGSEFEVLVKPFGASDLSNAMAAVLSDQERAA